MMLVNPPRSILFCLHLHVGYWTSRITLCVLLTLWSLILSPTALAQVDASALTAEEMLNRGGNSFNVRKYDEAEALFLQFLSQYGEAPEALEALPRVLPMLATAQIQQKKFPEALESIREFFSKVPNPKPELGEELLFWLGVCELQGGDSKASQDTFKAFLAKYPKSPKREEVVLLLASTAILAAEYKDAAQFLAEKKGTLNAENRGRAVVLELHSLIEAGEQDAAMQLLMLEFPNSANILQIVSFQTLALQLGSAFLEQEEYRKAIACLQRVWSHDRLLRHQQARLEDYRVRLEAAKKRDADAYTAITLTQMVAKVEREVTEFQKVENFDAALRLRLASAYLGMERYREAALIMEQMLMEMPASPLVEEATLNLNRCWMDIERWNKAIDASNVFAEKFPASKHIPIILYMRGMAEQNDQRLEEAIATFALIQEKYPDSEFAARANFMQGFTLLLAEKNEEAIALFENFPKKYKNHELADPAHYWQGMGYSLAKQHEKAREVLADYLKTWPEGRYRGEANFRRAYCVQSLMDFDLAITELRAFLDAYPGHANRSEALVLLGDALMAIGELDKGIVAFKQIDPADTRFFEEGWFKVGNAFKLQEEHERLRTHMEQFIAEHSGSPRLPEAVYWVGWTYRQADQPEEAKRVYWDAIEQFGNSRPHRSVEELFSALAKLYPGEEGRREYLKRLDALKIQAVAQDHQTLAMRSLWAQANLWERKEPARSILLRVEASKLADPKTTSPQILADCADALRIQKDPAGARALYRGILQWNPRATQRDRAFAGLGMLAMDEGKPEEALEYFTRFEERTLGSPLYATVLMQRARLLTDNQDFDQAAETLEKILASEQVSRAEKVAALYQQGEMEMQRGNPGQAVAYFQRIYVMYGRWPEFVAKSYLRSGEAFEQLQRTDEAIKTYEEMTAREDLQDFTEVQTARDRLEKLRVRS